MCCTGIRWMLLAILLMQVAAAWNNAYLPSRSIHRYLPSVCYQSSLSSSSSSSSSLRMSAMSSSFHNDVKTSTKHQQFEVGSPVVLTTRRKLLLNHVVVAASMVGVGGWIIRTSSDDDRIDDIRANALDMDAFVNAQVTKKYVAIISYINLIP
jgi:hypothetical protein